MSNQSGYVYLLKNEAMPGIYKIGMTNRTVEERVKELSLSTSIPLPFEVVCSTNVDNAKETEECFHEEFEEFRISSNREFFKFDDEELKNVISSFANSALCKMDDSIYEFDEIYGDDIKGKLIDIAIQSLNIDPFYIEDTKGELNHIKGSIFMSLLRLCFRQGDKVLVPMSLSKMCTVDEYKKILRESIDPNDMEECIYQLGMKNDLFELKELIEK